MNLSRKLFAELLGTALLLAVVIGSGVMAERLSGGNVAVALLANTLATVGGLYILIEVFGPVSGAHFNPAVSAVMAWRGELPKAALAPYIAAQLLGAMLGAWLAHAMFDMTIVQFSTKLRAGTGQWIAEGVATFGLLLVILLACIASTLPALFPTQVRYGAFAIGYNVSTSAFGGTTPLVVTALISATHSNLMPGWYMTAAGLIALVPSLLRPETAGESLRGRRTPGTARSKAAGGRRAFATSRS